MAIAYTVYRRLQVSFRKNLYQLLYYVPLYLKQYLVSARSLSIYPAKHQNIVSSTALNIAVGRSIVRYGRMRQSYVVSGIRRR